MQRSRPAAAEQATGACELVLCLYGLFCIYYDASQVSFYCNLYRLQSAVINMSPAILVLPAAGPKTAAVGEREHVAHLNADLSADNDSPGAPPSSQAGRLVDRRAGPSVSSV